MLLNIQRQPGTNIIGVVDSIQAFLPQTRSVHPQVGESGEKSSDRTITIRASVHDVEFELILTVVLVVW